MERKLHKMRGWLIALFAVVALMGATVDASAASVDVVFNDGTTDYSGNYGDYGMWEGKPSYNLGDAVIEWEPANSRWIFYRVSDSEIFNVNYEVTDDVPQNGWEAIGTYDVAVFSGDGTIDNLVLSSTVVNVVYTAYGEDLGGTYSYAGMVNTKPSYSMRIDNDNLGFYGNGVISWDSDINRWDYKLVPDMGTTTYLNNNESATDLVPQNGWVDMSGQGLATFSGTGTEDNFIDPYAGTVVNVVYTAYGEDLGGTYSYAGMVNTKPSYSMRIDNDNLGFYGSGVISWDSDINRWDYKLVPDMGTTTYLNNNESATDLVPQNGWVDMSGQGLATFSGTGTVNNTPTAIADMVEGFNLSVYPNPATDYVNVELSDDANLTVYSAAGTVVAAQAVYAGVNRVDLSTLNNGVYLLAVEIEGEVEIVKLLKK